MVWGCISAYGMDSLHVLEGTMNAERYIKVLEQHMLHLTFGASLNEKYVKDNHKLFSSWKPISARMGPNSNTKTPETHNLEAQTSSNCFERRGDATPW